MIKLISFLLLLLFRIQFALTANVTTEDKTLCGYFGTSIYCAGNFDKFYKEPTNMIFLPLETIESVNTNVMNEKWKRHSNTNTVLGIAKRSSLGQFTAIPDQQKMYFQGGIEGAATSKSFEEFSVDKNGYGEWNSFSEFTAYYSIRGSVAYVSSINKLVFYGALTDVPTNQTVVLDGETITTFPDNFNLLPFGFDKITTYDPETQKWEEIANTTGKPNDNFIYGNTLISPPGSDVLYSIGGSEIPRENLSSKLLVGFGKISKITFPECNWVTSTFTDIPSFRDFYTTTVLPDGKTLLMYGGVTYDKWEAVSNPTEFCYLFDIDKYSWRSCNISMTDGLDLFRYDHSAVLVEKHLFILYGKLNANTTLSSILIFDVSNSSNIKYVPQYTYIPPKTTLTNPPPDHPGLSTGGRFGIAVGCIALAAIIIGVSFYMRKRRAASTNSNKDIPTDTGSISEFPADWDRIDQYFVPTAKPDELARTVVNENETSSPPLERIRPSEI
ncbi:hypothetical protein BDB01DRAFT_854685 [Pilobolus umbonatus]|nr:hypothetical protein BDB01DRAFT_854685 [Pilobolus umbonatus]